MWSRGETYSPLSLTCLPMVVMIFTHTIVYDLVCVCVCVCVTQLAMLLLSKLMDTAAYYVSLALAVHTRTHPHTHTHTHTHTQYHGEGQFPNLFQIFSAALDDPAHQAVTYYALRYVWAGV